MNKAIKITAKKAPDRYDLGASKFFGTPTVPLAWEDDFEDDEIFFCQIRLSDIAPFDTENRLLHNGYLYVFLHTEDGNYRLRSDVRYFNGEPELAMDGFNLAVDGYESCDDAYLMEFSNVDGEEICTRLFGEPSDWNYEESPPSLFMQFDPLDSEIGFLDFLDGFVYLFFPEDEKDLSGITLRIEHS